MHSYSFPTTQQRHTTYFYQGKNMKLLHIDSSITGPDSVSRELTANLVRQWRGQHPDTQVEYLDLALEAPAHLNAESLGIRMSLAESSLSEAQKRENTVTETLVSQFLDADMEIGRASCRERVCQYV